MPSNPSNISSNPIFNGTNNKIANNYYNNNNINENSNSQQNPILINKSDIFNFSKSNPIINTPELVKTTERTLADVKPRKIFQNAENKEKITNKSIEIAPQEINNDLDKYLKTEIDVTPKSKKTAKVGILSLN